MDRTATAVWKGNLKEGTGTLDTQSGALKAAPYSFKMRF
ncbi:OsmC family peroxiredoxin, partial [Salmonella enterica subsp. enterica]|nr:OsmC family peroxiredoxin [Salmonella enterica subsp. enterica serovar Enteritidis]